MCSRSPVPIQDSRIIRATSVVMTAAVIPAVIWTMPWVQARLPTVLQQHRMIPGTAAHLVGGACLRWIAEVPPSPTSPTTTFLISPEITAIAQFGVSVKRISRMDGSDMSKYYIPLIHLKHLNTTWDTDEVYHARAT
ncbi:hypothetical protein JB92DRAFT_2824657 [Gautieria morchelliformis]|nr:hypothetical protein JB92DRAFT_2824657 [Gautieria morchelliformis]